MAMNREQKRALQRQGQIDADGAPVANKDRRQPARQLNEERTSPRQFVREVRSELKKTSWPTREETLRLALICFVAIVVLTAMIFGMDLFFGTIMDWLFKVHSSDTAAALAALPI